MSRIAVVGFGAFAPHHVGVLRELGAEVVAAVSRSDSGRARAHDIGIRSTYAAVNEMVDREKPDGIVSSVAFDAQFSVSSAILQMGVPLLVEKPPGTSPEELETLISLAHKHDTAAMVGFNRRHYSVLTQALADLGGAEAITGVHVDWSEDPATLLARGMRPELVALNTYRNSIHGLDLLCWLAGPLAEPRVLSNLERAPFDWVSSVSGTGSGGAVASFYSTWNAPGRWRVSFFGRTRRYEMAPLESCRVQERGIQGDRIIEPDSDDRRFKPGMLKQARMFLEMIESGESPVNFRLESARPSIELASVLTARLRADMSALAAATAQAIRVS